MKSPTAMGHMKQKRQNIRSTTKNKITSDLEDETATPASLGTKTHLVYAVLVDQGQLYTDLTRRFPKMNDNSKGLRIYIILHHTNGSYNTYAPK
jgi:hypothetical protein